MHMSFAAIRLLTESCQSELDDEGFKFCRPADILSFTLPKSDIKSYISRLVKRMKLLYFREGEKIKEELKKKLMEEKKDQTNEKESPGQKSQVTILGPKPGVKSKLSGTTLSFLRSRILSSFNRMRRSSSIHRKNLPNIGRRRSDSNGDEDPKKEENGEAGEKEQQEEETKPKRKYHPSLLAMMNKSKSKFGAPSQNKNPPSQGKKMDPKAAFLARRLGQKANLGPKKSGGDSGADKPTRPRMFRPPKLGRMMGPPRSLPLPKKGKTLEEMFDEDEEEKRKNDLQKQLSEKLYLKISKGVNEWFGNEFCLNDIPSLPRPIPDNFMFEPVRTNRPPPVSFHTQKGTATSRNEDRLCVLGSIEKLFFEYENQEKAKSIPDSVDFYAVFDGHGGQGCSEFCQSYVVGAISKAVKDWDSEESVKAGITEGYHFVDKVFCQLAEKYGCSSGATCTVVIVVRFGDKRKIYLANCGDSWGYVFRTDQITEGGDDDEEEEEGKKKKVEEEKEGEGEKKEEEIKRYPQLVLKTTNHKPAQEKDRITKAGGRVTYFYGKAQVNGALTVSRAIGDVKQKKFVIPTPAITAVDLVDLEGKGNWGFLIASDGLWDKVSIKESSFHVLQMAKDRDIARKLVKMSVGRGSKDDTTAVFSFL